MSRWSLRIAVFRSFSLGLLLFVGVAGAAGQNIQLKTGQVIDAKGLRRSGDMVMAKVQDGASGGEVGYQVVTIARVDFPEPRQLKTTAALLAQSQPEKALAEIEPVVKYYAPFRDLAGNWWAQAALLKVSALAGMGLDKEAETLAEQIRQSAPDPEAARSAQLEIVPALVRKEEFEKALQLCAAITRESTRPEVRAEAWVRQGDILLAQRHWDDAALAYLHVPVFYPDEERWMPPALLGSGRAFRGLEDLERATKSFKEVAANYPKTTEAVLAEAALQKLRK